MDITPETAQGVLAYLSGYRDGSDGEHTEEQLIESLTEDYDMFPPGDVAKALATRDARVRELEEENTRLKEKMIAINLVKTWTNEDGHSFMFTDDLLLALGEVTPEALARARQLKEEK